MLSRLPPPGLPDSEGPLSSTSLLGPRGHEHVWLKDHGDSAPGSVCWHLGVGDRRSPAPDGPSFGSSRPCSPLPGPTPRSPGFGRHIHDPVKNRAAKGAGPLNSPNVSPACPMLLEPRTHRQKLCTQDFSISSPAPAPI